MIEQVEKLHPELKPVLLPKLKLLIHDEIPVLLEGPAPGVARSVAVPGRSSPGCERHVGSSREARWIEIVFKPVGKRPLRIRARCVCTKESRSAAARVAVGTTTGAVSDREWQTALVGDYTAYTPAPKDRVVREALTRNRQII